MRGRDGPDGRERATMDEETRLDTKEMGDVWMLGGERWVGAARGGSI